MYLLLQVHNFRIYALAHFTKLKPTIDPVKCHYIKADVITQFHQRNRMISENAWNTLTRNRGSISPGRDIPCIILPPSLVKGALYSPLIWLPMRFNLFYNLQMVLTNVLYFFTGYKLTLVHSLVQTQLLNLL